MDKDETSSRAKRFGLRNKYANKRENRERDIKVGKRPIANLNLKELLICKDARRKRKDKQRKVTRWIDWVDKKAKNMTRHSKMKWRLNFWRVNNREKDKLKNTETRKGPRRVGSSKVRVGLSEKNKNWKIANKDKKKAQMRIKIKQAL